MQVSCYILLPDLVPRDMYWIYSCTKIY